MFVIGKVMPPKLVTRLFGFESQWFKVIKRWLLYARINLTCDPDFSIYRFCLKQNIRFNVIKIL